MDPLRLLLVDGDEVERAAIYRTVKACFPDAEVLEASGIIAAFALLRMDPFDCVLLDQLLPDGTGLALLERLTLQDRSAAFILMTRLDDEDLGDRALNWGADDYLVKQKIEPRGLKRSIRYAVERFRSRRDIALVVRQLRETNLELQAANEQLAALSLTDTLTGVPNRRAFDARLAQLLAEGGRGRPFTLVIADIDHFKQFNDEFGHRAGDETLVAVAQALAKTARATDHIARYGGEEFTVLLTDVDEARAVRQVERLMTAVRNLQSPYRPITISLGVCGSRPDLAAGELISCADRALYEAKRRGRNRFVLAVDCNPSAEASPVDTEQSQGDMPRRPRLEED